MKMTKLSNLEIQNNKWAKLFKKDVFSIITNLDSSYILSDKKFSKPESVDVIEVLMPHNNSIKKKLVETISQRWLYKILLLENIYIDDENLLWQKSPKYNIQSNVITSIERVAMEVSKKIINYSQNDLKDTYQGIKIVKKHLLVKVDATISFYITNIFNHNFLQSEKQGTKLIANEFAKFLNQQLQDIKSKFVKIIIIINIPALWSQKITILLETKLLKNQKVIFSNCIKRKDRKYIVVDNARNDYDCSKVGWFKISMPLICKTKN